MEGPLKIANFVPIRLQTWPSQQILVPDWFISKKIFSEMWPNEPKFGRKHLWKVQYKVCSKQNERWATQAQPTEPLVTIQTAYHLFWFLLQNVYHIFLVFFTKNCLYNIISFYHPFWIIWLFLLHISKRFFPFIGENGTLWLTKNRSTNGFYCLGVMALEIPENNSQHFYGIYIYVTCRTSPISRDPFITIKMYSKCKIKCVNLQFDSRGKKTFITEVDIWDIISLVIGIQIRIHYEWFLL